jgi:hypothetical protein
MTIATLTTVVLAVAALVRDVSVLVRAIGARVIRRST